MDGLRPSEKTVKNDFHSAAFGHWRTDFLTGQGVEVNIMVATQLTTHSL